MGIGNGKFKLAHSWHFDIIPYRLNKRRFILLACSGASIVARTHEIP